MAGARTKRLSARDRGLGKGRNAGKKYCTRLFGVRGFEIFRGGGVWKRTVDLFQAWLFGDWRSRMFVKRTPMTGELQLLVNIDVLISEDLRPGCSGDVEVQDLDDHSQTTPRSATSSDLKKRNL